MAFLTRSCEAYDAGHEYEAKRIAGVLRTLLHDSRSSRSLLGQLGLKGSTRFLDSSIPINPSNLLGTPGLFALDDGRWTPALDSHETYERRVSFDSWWTTPVTKLSDGTDVSRERYVLEVANTEGGAHIDPQASAIYDRLVALHAWPIAGVHADGSQGQPRGNQALAALRQIAHEVIRTLTASGDSASSTL